MPYDPIMNITSGCKEDGQTKSHLKGVGKEMIQMKVLAMEDIVTDAEKVYFASIAYRKLRNDIDGEVEIDDSLDLHIDAIISVCISEHSRFKASYPRKLASVLEDLAAKGPYISSFTALNDSEIDAVAEKTKTSAVLEASTKDERFSMTLFKNVDNNMISVNKINNLRRLHSSILVPIILYYKAKNEITGNILDVREGISQRNVLQSQGKAVIFSLTGIDRNVIIGDISSDKIEVEFGILRKEADGLLISLPYVAEGKIVRRVIDKKENW